MKSATRSLGRIIDPNQTSGGTRALTTPSRSTPGLSHLPHAPCGAKSRPSTNAHDTGRRHKQDCRHSERAPLSAPCDGVRAPGYTAIARLDQHVDDCFRSGGWPCAAVASASRRAGAPADPGRLQPRGCDRALTPCVRRKPRSVARRARPRRSALRRPDLERACAPPLAPGGTRAFQ